VLGGRRIAKSTEAKGTLTILVIRGPYVSQAPELAVRTAIEARRQGYSVNLFLYLDGVFNAHLTKDKDYHNPGEWLRWCVEKGINVAMCSRCTGARDLDTKCAIPGIRFGSVWEELTHMIDDSDKVLTFTE
jgi:sulfur relay (sulfurtransferase) complex TusBCD TusD component (DsrE family)